MTHTTSPRVFDTYERCAFPRSLTSRHIALALTSIIGLALGTAHAQITVDTKTGVITNSSTGTTTSTVDRRFQQIQPTSVPLSKTELDSKTRIELIRILEAEQGFAMRPFPRGHQGLTLAANGNLSPFGEAYLGMVTSAGLSAKPGDRVILSNIKIEKDRIVFDLNGGPDQKHRFLRHIQLGTGPTMNPVVQETEDGPTGARLTLIFQDHVPVLTGTEVKALLAPMISFDVKTPVEAYTDTLPPRLKEAILNHHVLVGMDIDMVLFAKGQPETKTREMDGQIRFEEWIYGKPPQTVEFVRFNGNRVIRLEVAKIGETPEIFTSDEVAGLMRSDGAPVYSADSNPTHTVKMGDVQRDPDKQAPAPPPSLRKPGEKSENPTFNPQDEMKPVQFPKPKREDKSGQQPPSGQSPSSAPDASQQSSAPNTQSTPNSPQP